MVPARSLTATRSQGGVRRSRAPGRSCQAKAYSAGTPIRLLCANIPVFMAGPLVNVADSFHLVV